MSTTPVITTRMERPAAQAPSAAAPDKLQSAAWERNLIEARERVEVRERADEPARSERSDEEPTKDAARDEERDERDERSTRADGDAVAAALAGAQLIKLDKPPKLRLVGTWVARRVQVPGQAEAKAGKAAAAKTSGYKAGKPAAGGSSYTANAQASSSRPFAFSLSSSASAEVEGTAANIDGVTEESAGSALKGALDRATGEAAERVTGRPVDAALTSVKVASALTSRPKPKSKAATIEAAQAALRHVGTTATTAAAATRRVVAAPPAREVQRWGPELQMRINAQGGDASMELELDNGERARIALRVRDGVAHVRVTGPASHAQLDDVMREVARIVQDAGLETGSLDVGTGDASEREPSELQMSRGNVSGDAEPEATTAEAPAPDRRVSSGLVNLIV